MKIVDVQTFLVDNIPPYQGGRRWLFVKLITDEGIEGIGEWSTGQTGREKSSIEIIKDLATQFVIDADPFKIELLWQKIYATDHDYRHPSLVLTPALSAIEMACWDIVGKALNQPVYNLLGGQYHEKLRAYAYMPYGGIWENPERAGEIAAELMEQGNTAMKFDPFPIFPAPRDIQLKDIAHLGKIFKCIRDAVGYEVEVGLGTHGQLTTSSAIRIAQMIEPYYPFWFEEPVSLENVDEMARVASHTSIPIATGERLLTKYEFVEIFQKQAAQIIQLDVGHCGGILESKKIASMAEAHYASIAPHMYCGPVAAAAAVQVATCSPNFLILEFNRTALHADIFQEPMVFDNGYIAPPTAPGLGAELNEEVLARHRVET